MSAGYRTIVADPPWQQGDYPTHLGGELRAGRGGVVRPVLPYPSLSVPEICDLPVVGLAARDCRLFLWTTNRYLPDSFSVCEAWGFRYRQMLVWHKNVNGSPFVASVAPNHAEYLLVCVRGKPERTGAFPSSVLGVPSGCGGGGRRHSVKPEAFLDYIESVSPGPYLEMFSRRARFGWDTWGDEALHGTELIA